MIARKIPKKSNVPDNYKRLAHYIAAAEEPGEKLDRFWIVNCNAGESIDDLDTALIEIEAIRRFKPKVADKTYHMIVSFRAGEKERLSDEDLRDIEETYAKALGFADHQRVVGTHINTDNFHMHIAFNKIHPETLKVHSPSHDYRIRDRVSRQLEKKYGLFVDNGMAQGKQAGPKLSSEARTFEAHTWQESFQNHVLQHRDELLERSAEVKNWQELHRLLQEFDINLKQRGNGLAFVAKDGQGMKASALDRSMSKKALENRLGPFEGHTQEQGTKPAPKRQYKPRPLIRHPQSSGLWRRYLGTRTPRLARPNLLNRTISNWKLFLITEAYQDPLAMVFIMAHQEMLSAVLGTPQPRMASFPKAAAGALRAWRDSAQWAEASSLDWVSETRSVGRGCRVDEAGNLIVPFKNAAGHMQAVRIYSPDGKMTEVGDMRAGVLTHRIGEKELQPGAVIFTASYADAVRIHDATRKSVVVVADSAKIAQAIDIYQRQHAGLVPVVATAAGERANPARYAHTVVTMPEAKVDLPSGIEFVVAHAKKETVFTDLKDALAGFDDLRGHAVTLRYAGRERSLLSEDWYNDGSNVRTAYADPALEGVHNTLRGRGEAKLAEGNAAVLRLLQDKAPAKQKPAKSPEPSSDEVRRAFAKATGDTGFEVWDRATEWATPGNSKWLHSKGLRGYGVKIDHDEHVLIPLKDGAGRVEQVLRVGPDGRQERVGPDQPGKVLSHVIDPMRRKGQDPIIIAQSYADAATIHRATRCPVVVPADGEQWFEAAQTVRKKHEDQTVVVALSARATKEDEDRAAELAAHIVRPERATQFASYAGTGQQPGGAKLLDYGEAAYKFDEDNSMSNYARLEDANGNERVLWGVGIVDAIDDAGIAAGDWLSLDVTGQKKVEVPQQYKDTDGNWKTRFVVAHRNIWKASERPDPTVAPTITALRGEFAKVTDDRAWAAWQAGEKPTPETIALRPELGDVGAWRSFRVDDKENVLVPLRDAGNRLNGVFRVGKNGDGELLGGAGAQAGVRHVIGDRIAKGQKDPVIVADDLISAVALNKISGLSVVWTPGADHLDAVVKDLQRSNKDTPVFVAASDSHMAKDNASLRLATEAAKMADGKVLRPPLTDRDKQENRTTFADLLAANKRADVVRVLREAGALQDKKPKKAKSKEAGRQL